MNREDKNNEAYKKGYDDARNESDPMARMANALGESIPSWTQEQEVYSKGRAKGLEDRKEYGRQQEAAHNKVARKETEEESSHEGDDSDEHRERSYAVDTGNNYGEPKKPSAGASGGAWLGGRAQGSE